jgi:cytidylate kinase
LKKLVIAIDGPAASGKSTTARLTAKQLGYLFIDTGAMYRAVTLKALEAKLDLTDEASIGELAAQTQISFQGAGDQLNVFLDGCDVTKEIRSPEVTRAVSQVSALRRVREVMVGMQRRAAAEGGVVLEGRDIGTVVVPDADLKIFLDAEVDKRAHRRSRELRSRGIDVTAEKVIKDIVDRDHKDSNREVSPLRRADDAVMLDTSTLTIEEQVSFVVSLAKKILKSRE